MEKFCAKREIFIFPLQGGSLLLKEGHATLNQDRGTLPSLPPFPLLFACLDLTNNKCLKRMIKVGGAGVKAKVPPAPSHPLPPSPRDGGVKTRWYW